MFFVACFNIVVAALILIFNVAATTAHPNILLIIVDDLRTTLGCYGDANAYTPNIDALAEDGIVFTEAFAQQALCAPSRNSFLTSRRPDTLRLYDFYSYWRDAVGNYTTLPEHLKNNGYTTMSIGKVFHPGISSNGSDDSPYSWTEKPFHPYTDRYKNAPVCRMVPQSKAATNLICPVRVSAMPNKTLPDLETLREARRFINKHKKDVNPFFLAVGFQKPHIPLKYPERYLKYYPIRKFKMPERYIWPDNVNNVAYNPWTDLRWRKDVAKLKLKFPWERIPAVSYIDNIIGKLINQLHVSMIRENTIVILTSDHGWALGEHAVWSKYSNFDVAVHVPLIISIPMVTSDFNYDAISINHMRYNAQITNNDKIKNKMNLKYLSHVGKIGASNISIGYVRKHKRTLFGTYIKRRHNKSMRSNALHSKKHCRVTDAIVELVDIFPTIADLAGVSIPICQVINTNDHLKHILIRNEVPNPCSEGITLLPLIKSTLQCQSIPWKKAAFSQYPRPEIQPILHPNSDKPRLKEINIMGYTLKTSDYRYTAWIPFAHTTCKPDWDVIIAEELYDHKTDRAEDFNVAALPEMLKTKKYLRMLLKDGWRNALPRY
ncbi:PREDICTED: iduronate 2-sulfatase isoform X2 [Trachymyrmex cornetzi]|uniref:iduronate 2-sulfatase isoform X2 n=1 Tax=Trachymyrmex cornetzi TaxID=471704 RepID=UPI00084EE360|nr:PREDICTED: iduronate 2-sulfatase isoform X2 [Trachymyrmex cornetzi]